MPQKLKTIPVARLLHPLTPNEDEKPDGVQLAQSNCVTETQNLHYPGKIHMDLL